MMLIDRIRKLSVIMQKHDDKVKVNFIERSCIMNTNKDMYPVKLPLTNSGKMCRIAQH